MLVPVHMASVEEHMPALLLHLCRYLGEPVDGALHLAELVLLELGLVVGPSVELGPGLPHRGLVGELRKGLPLDGVSGELLLVGRLPVELGALLPLVRLEVRLLPLDLVGHVVVLVAGLALELGFVRVGVGADRVGPVPAGVDLGGLKGGLVAGVELARVSLFLEIPGLGDILLPLLGLVPRVGVLVHAPAVELGPLHLGQGDVVRVAVVLLLGLVAWELLPNSPPRAELAVVLVELELVGLLFVRRRFMFDIGLFVGGLSLEGHPRPCLLVLARIVLVVWLFQFVGHVVLLVV